MERFPEMGERAGKRTSASTLLPTAPSVNVATHPSPLTPKVFLHVMWRNALNGSRDLYYISSVDGGKTFASIPETGPWDLDSQCLPNGWRRNDDCRKREN